MADRFDDATQVRGSLSSSSFLILTILSNAAERAPRFPRAGAGAGASTAVYPHVYQHVLGQVRSLVDHPPDSAYAHFVPTDVSPARPRHGSLEVKRAA